MRLFVSGSAPLLKEHLRRVGRRRTGHAILERYGMSETVDAHLQPLPGGRWRARRRHGRLRAAGRGRAGA
jgi:malonyl-CoA/methylmalonyl-CoA synthetase